jgi:hypothetical protein
VVAVPLQAPRAHPGPLYPYNPSPAFPPRCHVRRREHRLRLGWGLYVLKDRVAFFWRTPVPKGDQIAFLEVEAAAVGDAVFGPLLLDKEIRDEFTFVDNNVSLLWITSGCSCKPEVDVILAGLWLNLATRGGFKWWEWFPVGPTPAMSLAGAWSLCVRVVGACMRCCRSGGGMSSLMDTAT